MPPVRWMHSTDVQLPAMYCLLMSYDFFPWCMQAIVIFMIHLFTRYPIFCYLGNSVCAKLGTIFGHCWNTYKGGTCVLATCIAHEYCTGLMQNCRTTIKGEQSVELLTEVLQPRLTISFHVPWWKTLGAHNHFNHQSTTLWRNITNCTHNLVTMLCSSTEYKFSLY